MSTITEMQVSREDLNPCTVLLTVTCTPEQVAGGFTKAYKTAAKKIKVPGFRPGTAPLPMVKQYANPEYVAEIAAENIVGDAYKKAVTDADLEPHTGPKVELIKLSEETGECEFKAKVPLAPQIELGEYKGLKASKPAIEVTDQEIEEQIQELREGRAKRKAVENRGAQNGDFAVVNILPDDEQGEGRNFMTMVGHTFPGLDEALQGLKLDDIKQAELSFPAEFQEKDWAGTTKKCVMRLKSLAAPELPDLTDEFAQQFAAGSVDELKERIREGMTNAKTQMVENYVHEQLMNSVIEGSTIHVPDPMWEDVANQRMHEIAQDAARQGANLEAVAQSNNMSIEQLYERIKDEAKSEVQRALVLTEIFQKQEMKLGNEDIAQEVDLFAREMGVPPQEALKQLRRARRLDEVQFRALRKKVLSFLTENATIEAAPAP